MKQIPANFNKEKLEDQNIYWTLPARLFTSSLETYRSDNLLSPVQTPNCSLKNNNEVELKQKTMTDYFTKYLFCLFSSRERQNVI